MTATFFWYRFIQPVLIEPALCLQALSLKEAEKTVLSDRVSSLQAELSAAGLESERLAREASHYKEQEQVTQPPENREFSLHVSDTLSN